MFTTLSISSTALIDKLVALVSSDVSTSPPWFIAPSGLDLSIWKVEFPEDELGTTENTLEPPVSNWDFTPLHRPVNVFTPKTELAARLWEIRKLIVASGEPLLDWDDLEREVRERRAERG